MENNNDVFMLGGHEFHSRFILGSGKYNSHLIRAAVEYADAEIVTLALRRANTRPEENILDFIPKNVTLLPNTSGARNAEEAIRIARLARKMAGTDFVKVEIMRDSKYLLPDNQETIKATEVLANEGFVVMPYMYPDLNVARDLANAGAACIMPLASPIGSNKGLATKDFIQILIKLWNLPCKFSSKSGRCPCNQCYLHHTPITSCSVYNYHFRCYYLLFRRLLFPPLLFFTFFEFLQFCFLFTPDMSDLIFLGLIKHFWSNPTRSMRPDFLSASMTRS